MSAMSSSTVESEIQQELDAATSALAYALECVKNIAKGPDTSDSDPLWDKVRAREAERILDALHEFVGGQLRLNRDLDKVNDFLAHEWVKEENLQLAVERLLERTKESKLGSASEDLLNILKNEELRAIAVQKLEALKKEEEQKEEADSESWRAVVPKKVKRRVRQKPQT